MGKTCSTLLFLKNDSSILILDFFEVNKEGGNHASNCATPARS